MQSSSKPESGRKVPGNWGLGRWGLGRWGLGWRTPLMARSREFVGRWLVPFLRVAAEGGWLVVAYAALAVGLEQRAPVLGPFDFALLVASGAAVTVYLRRQPELGAILLILAVIAGGVVGWLMDPEVRSLLLSRPLDAFTVHGAGWLAALAVLRGSFVPGTARSAPHFENLLRYGLPGLALLWAAAAFLAPPAQWVSFGIPAVGGTVMLLVAAVLGLGLSRIEELREAIGSERLIRRWRLVVAALGLAVIPTAVPFVVLIGVPAEAVVGPIVGLLQTLLILTFYPISFIVWFVIGGLQQLAGGFVDQLPVFDVIVPRPGSILSGPEGPGADVYPLMITVLGIVMLTIVTAFLLVVVYLLALWLLVRREQPTLDDEADALGAIERAIVVPQAAPRPAARLRRGRAGPPRDAVGAYVHALSELDRHADYARLAFETPAAHATRVRGTDMPASIDLARLAADYQLARYGERPLTRSEDRRAVGRFERLRRMLRRGAPDRPR